MNFVLYITINKYAYYRYMYKDKHNSTKYVSNGKVMFTNKSLFLQYKNSLRCVIFLNCDCIANDIKHRTNVLYLKKERWIFLIIIVYYILCSFYLHMVLTIN